MGNPVIGGGEQIRYLLDAEESLRRANLAALAKNADLSVAHATIATACAVLATVPAELWRLAATRRELEARGYVERGQTLGPARPFLVPDDDEGGPDGG